MFFGEIKRFYYLVEQTCFYIIHNICDLFLCMLYYNYDCECCEVICMSENNELNTLYNGPGFEGPAFQQECNEKISKIKEKLDLKKEQLNDIDKKVKDLVNNTDWVNKYISGLSNYARNILSNGKKQNNDKYNNKLTQYIDNVRNQYKECINHAEDNFSKISDKVCNELSEEDLKQAFKKNNEMFIGKFSEATKNFKKQLYNLKKYAGTKSLYRIETLKHNLLYCKEGKDAESSNKLGFLDYLYFIIEDPDKISNISNEVSSGPVEAPNVPLPSSDDKQENDSTNTPNLMSQKKSKFGSFLKSLFLSDNLKKVKEASLKAARYVKNKTLNTAKSVGKKISNIISLSPNLSKKLREPFVGVTLDLENIKQSIDKFVEKLNNTKHNSNDSVNFKNLNEVCSDFAEKQIGSIKRKIKELFSSNHDDKKAFLGELEKFLGDCATSIQDEMKKNVNLLEDKVLSGCLADCMTAQVSCNLIKGFHLETSSANFYKDNRSWIVKTWGKMKKIAKFLSIIAAVGSLVLGIISLLMGNPFGIGAICSSLIALFKIFWSDIKIKISKSKENSGFFEKIGAAKKIIF